MFATFSFTHVYCIKLVINAFVSIDNKSVSFCDRQVLRNKYSTGLVWTNSFIKKDMFIYFSIEKKLIKQICALGKMSVYHLIGYFAYISLFSMVMRSIWYNFYNYMFFLTKKVSALCPSFLFAIECHFMLLNN